MTEQGYVALVHAEIDGELDGRQRGELARHLLANPEARALREDLLRLRRALDAIEDVEPPAQLGANILRALPVPTTSAKRFAWPAPGWRYAALVAGVLVGAAVVYETVDGPGPGSTELAGTIATSRAPVTLDTVHLDAGAIAGRVSLYRDAGGLALAFELHSSAPVDVLITSGGHTLRVNGVGRQGSAGEQGTAIALPGSGATAGHAVELTFLMSGREVGHATLRVPESR
jgi:hypothetical protein